MPTPKLPKHPIPPFHALNYFDHRRPRPAEVQDALKALQAVQEKRDGGTMEAVAQTLLAPYWWEVFMGKYRLAETTGHQCLTRLVKGHCGRSCYLADGGLGDEVNHMGIDHPRLFLRDGKPAVFVYQPYSLSAKELGNLSAFALRHGLNVNVGAGSWHMPGATTLVELWAKGVFESFDISAG